MPHRGHTILARLLIVYLVMALPMALIGAYFINRTLMLQDQQNRAVLQQRLDHSIKLLGERLRSVQGMVIALCGERELSLLASRPEDLTPFDRAMVISAYQSRLSGLQAGNPHISLISLVIPALSLQVHSIANPSTQLVVQMIEPEEAQAFFEAGRLLGSEFTVAPTGMGYYHQSPALLSYAKNTPPRIMLRVDYDLPAICAEMCEPFLASPVRCAFVSKTGELLYSNGQQSPLQALREAQADGCVRVADISGESYYLCAYDCRMPDAVIIFSVSRQAALGPTLRTRAWLYVIFALLTFSLAVYSYYAYSRVQIPVNLLLAGFGRLEKGDMEFRIDYVRRNEFSLLVQRFNQTLLHLKTVVTQLYEQKILTQQAEMKHLQAQINPHFLYNTFYTLDNMLLLEDHESARVLCRQLGNYFKYVTRSDKPFAHLREEIDHSRSYVEIQQIRFQGDLQVCFETPPADMDNPAVPRLILQPLLENAFKHSLEQTGGEKQLSVRFAQDAEYIDVIVENSGAVIPEAALSELIAALNLPAKDRQSTGLANVEQRLRMTHGTGLTLRSRPEGGLYVRITFRRFFTEDELSRCGL